MSSNAAALWRFSKRDDQLLGNAFVMSAGDGVAAGGAGAGDSTKVTRSADGTAYGFDR